MGKVTLQDRVFFIVPRTIKFAPRVTTELDRAAADRSVSVSKEIKNPFKEPLSFEYECDLVFKDEISEDVADVCNLFLPSESMSRCVPFTHVDKYFSNALWVSRYLANLEFNKEKYEEDIKRIARQSSLGFGSIPFSPVLHFL